MGVDTSIKVRMWQNGNDACTEVQVSDQDNALGSLFFGNQVTYTSISN
jgi:hypothetical protein